MHLPLRYDVHVCTPTAGSRLLIAAGCYSHHAMAYLFNMKHRKILTAIIILSLVSSVKKDPNTRLHPPPAYYFFALFMILFSRQPRNSLSHCHFSCLPARRERIRRVPATSPQITQTVFFSFPFNCSSSPGLRVCRLTIANGRRER